jgi:hypothetical protein
MATQRQIEANRRNAAGPHNMSEEGKQAVRGNALRHGLATKVHVVLPGEDQAFYNQILHDLRNEYAPSTTQEEMLVHQIAENFWRILRARNMETGSLVGVDQDFARKYDVEPAPADDLLRGAQLAIAFTTSGKMFDKISRYETTAERSYYRAIRELTKLQKNRPKSEIGSDLQNAQQETPEPVAAPQPVPEIRSVPKNRPKYTQRDMELAHATMSEAEFDALLDEITAPPSR